MFRYEVSMEIALRGNKIQELIWSRVLTDIVYTSLLRDPIYVIIRPKLP